MRDVTFSPRGAGPATGRWIAEEIRDDLGALADSENYFGVYQPCATEAIARAIAARAATEGWRVEVYPERTTTGTPDGNFDTIYDAETGFRRLNAWDEKYG